jgi:hypothetical protein
VGLVDETGLELAASALLIGIPTLRRRGAYFAGQHIQELCLGLV